jgi:hypothetical protein
MDLAGECEWDESKAAANLGKHGIDFTDAALVLDDDFVLIIRDLYCEEEDRFVALGCDPTGRLLVVIYTWRGSRVRLISARKATSREMRQYEQRREQRRRSHER